ncbi:MAG: glycosyltransferase [Candidatus Sericytochromatia bacterium]|nr:glycosyltransferase [Candidatus Sericytochromatia bacterium]
MTTAPALSVVIATYNRGPILEKCLQALLDQTLAAGLYEIVVVDDGSTDDTPERIARLRTEAPAWIYHRQENAGRSRARNVGVSLARGELVVFIDSDVVVVPEFLALHLALHRGAEGRKVFVQGLAVDTDDFERPTQTPVGPLDASAAYFATNNVSVPRAYLQAVGGFDEGFVEYGWEDLELGLRLRAQGVGIVRSREARGFHWHPRFSLSELPAMRRTEEERGRMAARFYRLHPTWEVRLMIQLTPLHRGLDWLVRLGGLLDEQRIEPALRWLLARGQPMVARRLAALMLNRHNLRTLHAALAEVRHLA